MNCSNYNSAEGSEFRLTPELLVFGVVVGAILAIVAITGNVLVVLAIHRTTALRTITNYFLASLASADICTGAIALPSWLAWSILSANPAAHGSTKARNLAVFMEIVYVQCFSASTYNLCAVTIDRYIAVRWPLRYHSLMTVEIFSRVVPLVWLCSILAGCIRLVIKGHMFWLVTAIFAFVVPFAVISYCYAYMLKEARRQNRDASERTVGEMAARAENHKAAVTVAIVIGMFLLFTLPMTAVTVTETILEQVGLCEQEESFERGSAWALLASFSNSAMNPLIYAARKREFRVAIKKMIRKHSASNAVHQTEMAVRSSRRTGSEIRGEAS